MELYIVIAYKGGHKDRHHYIVGLYSTLDKAKRASKQEEEFRGGNRYACAIYRAPISAEWTDFSTGFIEVEVKPIPGWLSKDDQGKNLINHCADVKSQLFEKITRLQAIEDELENWLIAGVDHGALKLLAIVHGDDKK